MATNTHMCNFVKTSMVLMDEKRVCPRCNVEICSVCGVLRINIEDFLSEGYLDLEDK